jgi:S1-C subfamily serine protease
MTAFYIRKFFIGVLVAALTLTGICVKAQSKRRRAALSQLSAKQIAKKVLPSVVLVVVDCNDGRTFTQGSGFFVDRGLIATNKHVVECGQRGFVKFVGQDKVYPIVAQWLAPDASLDLALLKVEGVIVPALPLSNDQNVSIADTVYAAGSPKGLESTFSDGIISSVRQSERLIQHTAPISPGSSGGPLIDEYGQVIGIVRSFGEGQNLNFAIPSPYLKKFLSQVKSGEIAARSPLDNLDRLVLTPTESNSKARSPKAEADKGATVKTYPPVNVNPPVEPKLSIPDRPPSLREMVIKAETDFRNGRYDRVITACVELLKNNPDQRRANLLLGKAYYETKDYERSIPYLAKAIKLGEKVTFPITHHRRVFAGEGDNGPDNDLSEGEIILQKESIEFRRTSERTKTGVQVSDESFSAPLSKIYELKYETDKSEKLKMEVGIQYTEKGVNKEKRRTYNFYPGDAKVEHTGMKLTSMAKTQISCVSCSPVTKIIYNLLLNIRK